MNHRYRVVRRRLLGEFESLVVGLQYHQGRIRPEKPLKLVREPNNGHDPNAIAVLNSDDEKVGYIPREDAAWLAPMLDSGDLAIEGVLIREEFTEGARTLPLRVAAYALRSINRIIYPRGREERALFIHQIVRQFYRSAQRENDPARVADMAAALDPLARQELLPETRLLLELLRSLEAEISAAWVVRAQVDLLRAVSEIDILPPAKLGNLNLFPLRRSKPSSVQWLCLEEALGSDAVEIVSIDEVDQKWEAVIKNNSDRPVLVIEGEQVINLDEGLTADRSLIVRPGRKTLLPLRSNIVPGNGGTRQRFDPPTALPMASGANLCDHSFDQTRQGSSVITVPITARTQVISSSANQRQVPYPIAPSNALQSVFPEKLWAIDWPVETCGVCAVEGNRLLSVQLYPSSECGLARLPSAIDSLVAQFGLQKKKSRKSSLPSDEVRRLLRRLGESAHAKRATVTSGDWLEFEQAGYRGGALLYAGELVFLQATLYR